ncbi:MAG: beta-ketoacyl-[acyl-carrier-protein] synthase family protein [Flavobacteriales bacterium]|nr:beta-ketoacyl-[acyl-carrier-protein] synthase family protein [Flavobacteriales bacterium]
MNSIVVSGIGVITAIGNTIAENIHALENGKTGIINRAAKNQNDKTIQFPLGKIDLTNEELIAQCEGYEPTGTTRTDALSKVAFQDAIRDAGLTASELKSPRTAFISASTVGGMSRTMELYEDATTNDIPSEFINSYSASVHLHKIVNYYNMTGPTSVINTACSSSANAIMLGAKMLEQDKVDIAIVGGVDCISRFTIRGFDALGILTKNRCKPFDINREGLNLGEAASYLVLRKSTQSRSQNKYGSIVGWANTNDSFHSSALNEDGSGIMNCINKAIQIAKISTDDIGFINAHGTGTVNNDLAELTAVSKLFKPGTPIYSSKSYTGHTLGAAGAIECVFSLIGLNKGQVYPSLNVEKPLKVKSLQVNQVLLESKDVKYALSNSFGFNGNCTSLIIAKKE